MLNSYFFNAIYTTALKPVLLACCLASLSSACTMRSADRPIVPVTLLAQSADNSQGFVPLSAEFTEIDRGLLLRMENKVFFAVDSAALRPEAAIRLNEIANTVNQYPNRTIAIEGYTDNTGPAAYNLELSQMRAVSVKNALIQRGVAANRMTTKGFGETKPVAKNNSATNRQKNRRVEIIILNNPTGPARTSNGMNVLSM